MIDLKAIRAAAESVKAWGSCNKAWLNTDEDEQAAQVGAVCEEGVRYPVATVDCDQYLNGKDSLPLAKFYAAANPATLISLLDRLDAAEVEVTEQARLLGSSAEKELALMARLEAVEKDAVRLNWLEQNLFNRENIDWVTKKPCTKFNMWVLFSPVGMQGSARAIIDAAMEGQKK